MRCVPGVKNVKDGIVLSRLKKHKVFYTIFLYASRIHFVLVYGWAVCTEWVAICSFDKFLLLLATSLSCNFKLISIRINLKRTFPARMETPKQQWRRKKKTIETDYEKLDALRCEAGRSR